jgi:hypothetical protein
MRHHSTRRHLIGSTLVASSAALVGATQPASIAAAMRQDATPAVGEAGSPAWVLVVHTFQDPYAGEIIRPEEPQPGIRYIGAEVEIRNESEDPLNFSPGNVRLMDSDGIEYPSGAVAGSDPLIASLNMSPGDRVRGWVWYGVPEASQIVEVVYIAPSPRIVVALPQGG